MKSKAKLYPSLKPFQGYVTCRLHARKLGWFLIFTGQESNCQFDFRLLFWHNLCFRCSNGQCEPILDIYVSIDFQWYKKLFKAIGFDSCNCALKIQESIWDSNSQHGSVKVHSFALFAFLGTCDTIPESPSWLATLQPLALVTSPRLGLRQYWPCIGFYLFIYFFTFCFTFFLFVKFICGNKSFIFLCI